MTRMPALREKIVFKFTPMVDLDGCANGQVRSNANGFDVNQHWAQVDLRHPQYPAADAGNLVHKEGNPKRDGDGPWN